jgi:hypothetical protein
MTNPVTRQILDTLAPYRNSHHGTNRYNTPWRPSSDGGTLAVDEDTAYGLGLKWFDHKTNEAGNGYTLARNLGVTLSGRTDADDTPFASLTDYAHAHGVTLGVFERAGWSETERSSHLAFAFKTKNGVRYRYADPKAAGRKYDSTKGYTACWYGLTRAVELASAGAPFVICNGEASTVAAQHHGLAACCITGGEKGSIPATLLDELKAAWMGPIRVAFDCDVTGRRAGAALARFLQAAGYDARAIDLGGAMGFDLADFCRLNNGTSAAALSQAKPLAHTNVDTTTGEIRETPRQAVAADGRPQIEITTVDLPTIMPQAWDALLAANNPPTLFWRAQELVRLETTEDGALTIIPVDTRRMLGILARAAWWVRRKGRGDEVISIPTTPPAAVVDDCLVNIDPRVPILTRVVHSPVYAGAGELLAEPGYHAGARLYYDPRGAVALPPIPDDPTVEEMLHARDLVLDDLFVDFPFSTDADRAHAVALFLLPFVRDLISGPTPLHLVEAPTMGSGKGLLSDAALMPALGELLTPITEAPNDEEWRKLLTSALRTAPAALLIDNISRVLDSGSLAAALTTETFANRVLGRSEQVLFPVRCVWIATANNPALSPEISRRCIRIRIDPRVDRPWERSQFKHPKLRAWIREQRGPLIAAALALVRYGLKHGTPSRSLGSYEAWSDVIGRILDGCGIPGFLTNLDALYDRADAEGAAWRALIATWWSEHRIEPQTAGELYPLVAQAEADMLISGKDEIGRKKSFGRALARIQDRVFSVDLEGDFMCFQVSEAGSRHKVKLWCLVPMEAGG